MGSHQFHFHYGRPAGKYQETCDHRGRSSGEDLRPRSLREGCVRRGAVQADRLSQPGEEAKFHLWDTAGQEAYEEARRVCYDGTHVLLIGFSVVEPDSLANVENLWAKEAKLEALRDAPKLLVGLKADLKNDEEIKEALAKRNLAPVTEAAAKEMATKIGAKGYFETSAKENKGVMEVFEEAARIACNVDPGKPKKKKLCVL